MLHMIKMLDLPAKFLVTFWYTFPEISLSVYSGEQKVFLTSVSRLISRASIFWG
jgi:hypothetical protein